MKERLKYSEFVPLGEDLSPGEQIHVNHEDCPAGQDTKRRLYIKREDEDGTNILLAHCHHCNKSGFYVQSKKAGTYTAKRTIQDRPIAGAPYGGRKESSWDRWSERAKSFVREASVRESDTGRWRIEYCPDVDMLYFPVYRAGSLAGYQLRALDGSEPKYVTEAIEKPLYWYTGHTHDTLVIVEDILSGIRCSKHASALALLCSDMGDEVLEHISRSGHTNFVVFLDDDNSQVRRAQMKIANRLAILGPVKIIRTGKDPKRHTDQELEELLV